MNRTANLVLRPDPARVFDQPAPLTVGVEEEIMLLHPRSLDLLPRAAEVLLAAPGDDRMKGELPASQLELVTPPCETVGEAAAHLRAARHRLATAARGIGRLGAAGMHPFTSPEGELNNGGHYGWMAREYGWAARRQLLCGLHVHVAVRPAPRAIAVYNALRGHLPELAALAANAPFYAGVDTGLASIRPKLADLLPRQGVPPAFADVEQWAGELRWGARAGSTADPRRWWWELRLHPVFGTIEVRVCDAQTTVARAAALTGVVHALCARLAERHEAGDLPAPAPSWRIEENRWSACRYGVHGSLADLRTGDPLPTRERLRRLLDDLVPAAARLGCMHELHAAGELLERPGADQQRAVAAERGLRGLCAWLVEHFLD